MAKHIPFLSGLFDYIFFTIVQHTRNSMVIMIVTEVFLILIKMPEQK